MATDTKHTQELILDMVDEATVPARMSPADARQFLYELRDEIMLRIETLVEENPELARR